MVDYVFPHITVKKKAQDSSLWNVRNKRSKEIIGEIQPYIPWKQYIFHPFEGTIYSSDCLENVVLVLKILDAEDKKILNEVNGRASSQD